MECAANSAVHGSNWLHLQRAAQDAKTLVEIEMRKNSVVETFDFNTVVLVAFRFETLTPFIPVRYIQKEEASGNFDLKVSLILKAGQSLVVGVSQNLFNRAGGISLSLSLTSNFLVRRRRRICIKVSSSAEHTRQRGDSASGNLKR